ncbi:unnamed protein product [Blumeria hordei]|uniref:tRNA-splicing endonuclease subunit Sen54 N-terminal domain-containing protein n=2 Tax=Blumeria hordei TaxID=2867405 RepID=A0A383V1W3_BLUHO|nr:tRNA-splicing endonuclease subunit sen-54 [Blumeria hordei DH14]SZF05532.1 unnamed protein product [Blumeria hordei]
MAEFDEDALLNHQQSGSHEDIDPTEETQDFRFLANIISQSSSQLPKRGEKDFEPHGTKHQEGILEASRNAMHAALSHTRSHNPKNHVRGFYFGDEYEGVCNIARQGLYDDHVVLVQQAKGPHFKTIGKMTTGQKTPSLWLLPEEALYLIERGFLDLCWPADKENVGERDIKEVEHESDRNETALPLSLQAAYALLVGDDDEKGKVSLHRYTVYANLRRTGYVVLRAPDFDPLVHDMAQASKSNHSNFQASMFHRLFGRLFTDRIDRNEYESLVKAGMYRSYGDIYRQITIIPRHKPQPARSTALPSSEDPYRVVFYLWKADRMLTFSKRNPSPPDFRLAIVDAQTESVPSLMQMISLLESTQYAPPDIQSLAGAGKIYQRLKHGWRSVILAVVDQGVISFLKLGESAFGEELIYERFDGGASSRGGKRGGYRGRGGRGRGRGHSRGT